MIQVDVFSERPLAGNPLAIFPDAEGLSGEQMQQIAGEMNLSETTFVSPPEAGGDARVRIFTPAVELPFAGHPSIGTACSLVSMGRVAPQEPVTEVTRELNVGPTVVDVTVRAGPLCSRKAWCFGLDRLGSEHHSETWASERNRAGRPVPATRTSTTADRASRRGRGRTRAPASRWRRSCRPRQS